MAKKKNLTPKFQVWVDARRKFRLSHGHIQMARELGMNPKKFGKLANHDQEPWKAPLPIFIEDLYFKRFRKDRPETILSIEDIAKEKKRKQLERKQRKLERREQELAEDPSRRNAPRIAQSSTSDRGTLDPDVRRDDPVTAREIEDLREAVGWERFENKYDRILPNSYTHFTVREIGKLIAFVNVISDGIGNAFLVDLIVDPEYQRQGLGRTLVKRAVADLTADGIKSIEVVFDPKHRGLYRKCGFHIVRAGIIDNEPGGEAKDEGRTEFGCSRDPF